MTVRSGTRVLATSLGVVALLFTAFEGFLRDAAPPQESGPAFAVGLASLLSLGIFLLVEVAVRARLGQFHRRFWIVACLVVLVLSTVSGIVYSRLYADRVVAYPPDQPTNRYVIGTTLTDLGREELEQWGSPGEVLVKNGGPQNVHLFWTRESIAEAALTLTASYIILVASIGISLFALAEVLTSMRDRSPELPNVLSIE
jgi:hypothetical protein